eukprot:gene6838-11000_t
MQKQENKAETSDSTESLLDEKLSNAAVTMKDVLKEYTQFIDGEKNKMDLIKEEVIIQLKEIEDQKIKIEKLYDCQIIELNVGGKYFTTSIETIQTDEDSMLYAMFSGKYPLQVDKTGKVFIDRDDTHFRKILNYLRTGVLITPLSSIDAKELLLEAEFYNLKNLIRDIKLQGNGIHLVKKLDSKTATFRWRLSNFSLLNYKCESEVFELNGQQWYLRFYPAGEKDNGTHVTLYLIYAGPDKRCTAHFILRIINQQNDILSYSFDGGSDVFRQCNGWGKSEFFACSKFNDDILFDDSIVIEAYIKLE